jgi:hypothetical protein
LTIFDYFMTIFRPFFDHFRHFPTVSHQFPTISGVFRLEIPHFPIKNPPIRPHFPVYLPQSGFPHYRDSLVTRVSAAWREACLNMPRPGFVADFWGVLIEKSAFLSGF